MWPVVTPSSDFHTSYTSLCLLSLICGLVGVLSQTQSRAQGVIPERPMQAGSSAAEWANNGLNQKECVHGALLLTAGPWGH